jgi:hypothetical protein
MKYIILTFHFTTYIVFFKMNTELNRDKIEQELRQEGLSIDFLDALLKVTEPYNLALKDFSSHSLRSYYACVAYVKMDARNANTNPLCAYLVKAAGSGFFTRPGFYTRGNEPNMLVYEVYDRLWNSMNHKRELSNIDNQMLWFSKLYEICAQM